jgi:hypothetical protein
MLNVIEGSTWRKRGDEPVCAFSKGMALDRLVKFRQKGRVVVLASFDDLSLFFIVALSLCLFVAFS